MKIERLVLGMYETNCYVLGAEDGNDCVIVDTGLVAEPLVDFLKSGELNPLAVILTHGHADHILGLGLLGQNFPDIKVYIHKLDAGMLTGETENLSEMTGVNFRTKPADVIVEDGDVIDVAGIKLEVLHTPGHTPGGICLYAKQENVVFVGDTLFAGSVGRTDFPNGSMTQLVKGIKEKLFTLPGNTVCYSGHGDKTTIEQEKKYNPFLT
ncbi:MAG: MBL fold metallo-hydrolase [Planctomycetes bacterium]|nr:MBL fold metallo-hydrolase [Planctomycetota bacterium]